MLASDTVRFGLTGLLAAAVLAGFVSMPMIYVPAFLFGLVSGVFIPAAVTAVPRLLPDAQLKSGNALLQGVSQVAQFLGPPPPVWSRSHCSPPRARRSGISEHPSSPGRTMPWIRNRPESARVARRARSSVLLVEKSGRVV